MGKTPLSKNEVALPACGVFFAALIIYTLTLYPGVPGGDSGELITVAHAWGVAHPPGYPLYTLIAHLFTLLPLRTLAWRVNFLSAVCDAGAAGLLTSAVVRAGKKLFPGARAGYLIGSAIFAGGLFAFSPGVWRYATQAEVFPLNNLYVSALLYLSILYSETPSNPVLYLAALVTGLGVFHQQLFIFCAIPFLFWVVRLSRQKKGGREWLICTALFCLGFLPYLYLPIAGSFHPAMSWGEPTTFHGFLVHFFRQEYGTFQLGSFKWKSTNTAFDHLAQYFKSIPQGFLGGLFVLGLPGLWLSWRRFFWLPLAYATYLLAFCSLSNAMLELPIHREIEARFWQQPNLILFFWCGLGFAWVATKLPLSKMKVFFILLGSLGLVVTQIAIHYRQSDQSKTWVVQDYARSVLESLEPHSILIVTSDVAWNATQYLQICENFRGDIRVVSQEMMSYPWMREKIRYRYPNLAVPTNGSMLEFLRSNPSSPIYLSFQFRDSERVAILKEYELIPIGLFDRVIGLKDPSRLDKSFWVKRSDSFWSHFDLEPALQAPEGTWEYFIGQLGLLYKTRKLVF